MTLARAGSWSGVWITDSFGPAEPGLTPAIWDPSGGEACLALVRAGRTVRVRSWGKPRFPPRTLLPDACARWLVERRLDHGLIRPGGAGPYACHLGSIRGRGL